MTKIIYQIKGQDTISFVKLSRILTFVLCGLPFEGAASFRHPETERHNKNRNQFTLYTKITGNSSTEPTKKIFFNSNKITKIVTKIQHLKKRTQTRSLTAKSTNSSQLQPQIRTTNQIQLRNQQYTSKMG